MISLILLFPLLGFLTNGLWYLLGQTGKNQKPSGSTAPGIIATIAIFGAFLVSLKTFIVLHGMPEEARAVEETLFNWMQVGDVSVPFRLRVDALSTLFTLVITGVGTLIHIYSIGYMSHDETPGKFFAYLNLFCFAMLALVLGASLPILFLGWEGVGLCSYLLIGYWYADDEKAIAGKKAFVVNRIGDFGFILGMFVLFSLFGTLDFAELKTKTLELNASGALDLSLVTVAGLLLFVGCTGKSAQIPLYVWLPDAMAGPTPVSALIHAATMVTSGIYMLARLNFLFSLSPTALMVIAWVGGLTAFMAATIAIAQTDIKKVLAYSTVSQLGYMFLGVGVGAYTAGVFHVITHAFFKALLFLGAGSVIHGMHEEQDILKMGGLKKYMPHTFAVFAVAWLAICGIPPFSGFFSKDEILWKTFSSHHGSKVLWLLATGTAVMTAFYMTRLFSLTFLGAPRFKNEGSASHGHRDHHDTHHSTSAHESPWVMVAPLYVLAILSALGGFMGIPHMSWLDHWLGGVIPEGEHAADSMEWVLMGLSVAGATAGILYSLSLYKDLPKAHAMKQKWASLHRFLQNKWFIDEAYFAVIVNPLIALSKALWKGFDVAVIDRVVLGFGRVSAWTGQTLRVTQTGLLQSYAVITLFALILTLGYLVYGLS